MPHGDVSRRSRGGLDRGGLDRGGLDRDWLDANARRP